RSRASAAGVGATLRVGRPARYSAASAAAVCNSGCWVIAGLRRLLVLEQLTRRYPQRAAQSLDRVGPNQAKPPVGAAEAVNRIQAQAGELGQSVGRHAPCLQQLVQPQAQHTSTTIAHRPSAVPW